MESQGKISVVIPFYNEEEGVDLLFDRLLAVLESFGRPYEVIAVNDGSRDETLPRLLRRAESCPAVKVIDFARNEGQTAALQAGFDHATGDIVVPMDADLQNSPEDIPMLVDKLEAEGWDVVSGWRKNRQDAVLKRTLPSRVANKLISMVSGIHLHDYGCTLKAYRSEVLKDVRLYGEMHRFIPIYASWNGAKVTEVPVAHHVRTFGKSKYGVERTLKVSLDLLVTYFLTKYLRKPIYVFGGFGVFLIGCSLLAGLAALALKLAGTSLVQTPLPLISVVTFSIGVSAVLMGLLAEVTVRTYFESQNQHTYRIKRLVNLGPESGNAPG